MNYIKKYYVLFALLVIGVVSCEKSKIMYYEGDNTLHFQRSEQNLSFLVNPQKEKDTMIVKANLGGYTANYERTFSIEVIDSNTTATSEHYHIIKSVVPANDTVGYIYIEVINPKFTNTGEHTFQLALKLIDDDNFKAGARLEKLRTTLSWTINIAKPDTWRDMAVFCCPYYASNVYEAIIEATGYLQFYYYQADSETGIRHSMQEGYVLGRKFGEWVRNYNATHDEPLRYSDGDHEGEIVVPKY